MLFIHLKAPDESYEIDNKKHIAVCLKKVSHILNKGQSFNKFDFMNLLEITMSLSLSFLINHFKYLASCVPSASIDIRI